MHFDEQLLKNPAYFAQNRLAAHSDHVAYASMQELASGQSSLRYSLNGLWKFHYARNPGQVIPGFEAVDFDCSDWADIPVPAHMQMEGYGAPQYTNVQYPWDGCQDVEIGEIPERFNPVGSYVRTFFLPEAMRGKRVFISFDGAESCVALWLNGQYVGFTSDSFTPHAFELTPYLCDGLNKLACRVYRFSAGSWLEDQDFLRFSGLYRDVWLYAACEAHIEDVRIKTLLDDDYTDAVLDVRLRMLLSPAAAPGTVRLALTDGSRVIASSEQAAQETVSFRLPVSAPKLWSSESPFLYDLLITAADETGVEREVVRERVGFRRFELRDGVMQLNGRRIVFKGVNRHDFCAETGRAVTPDVIRRDLLTMKRNNINAVRTSHYPNHSALYALCDELGLYVIDENNMETHGTWDPIVRGRRPLSYALPGNRMEWLPILLDRVTSTYERDKNHPCVLVWSCGNESFGGEVIYEMSALFRRLDDTRLVHYEGVTSDRRRNDSTDIESQMYTPVTELRRFLAEHRSRPFILCEYAHAMGNSNGAMHKYTEYAYEEPLYQGGFIWDFIDQSIRTKDRYGLTTYAYGGDFDDRPTDYNFCGNGIVYGDGKESPKMQEVRYNYQNITAKVDADRAIVTNRSMFTPTSAFACVATLARDGVEIARAELATDVPPSESREYALPFPAQTRAGEYAVTLSFRQKEATPWAPCGHEVAFAQGVYKVAGTERATTRHAPLRIVRGECNTGVQGEHFQVLFGDLAGGLISYRYGGREMLRAVPRPNFWRAPIDNDMGNGMPVRYAQWKIASVYASTKATAALAERNAHPQAVENPDGSVSLSYVYGLATTPPAECSLTYTVHPCGQVTVTLAYDPVEGLGDMPEFGVMFKLDADCSCIRYYGLGPDENYVDRHEGARLGIFRTTARDNLAHYLVPQECGNRTGVRWAEVTDFRGRGLRFTGDAMEFSALPYTPHELENAAHEYELPPVHYTVVRASQMQMGVGGDNSWGARTHEEYLLDVGGRKTFTFSFRGIV
ncbi:MAG TPA: DUF4981 domain-containing protein [Candidatus Avichristensenella intestinipullorum]|uniref:Beta-galactosidase n=1 Tax=Candidatus Avichristensenella intestinipullorum TaxID=2840693 RepID=A0A9D1CI76_9FIRM|nr:DUF4981 domain-containing protein [Candidatus Avichristensenella intestinipullorum]